MLIHMGLLIPLPSIKQNLNRLPLAVELGGCILFSEIDKLDSPVIRSGCEVR